MCNRSKIRGYYVIYQVVALVNGFLMILGYFVYHLGFPKGGNFLRCAYTPHGSKSKQR